MDGKLVGCIPPGTMVESALEQWVYSGEGCLVPQAAYDALCKRPDNELLRRRVDEHMKALAAELAALDGTLQGCGVGNGTGQKIGAADPAPMHQPVEEAPTWRDEFAEQEKIAKENVETHRELRRLLGL